MSSQQYNQPVSAALNQRRVAAGVSTSRASNSFLPDYNNMSEEEFKREYENMLAGR